MEEKKMTQADQIWEKIKDLKLELWGLDNQVLNKNAERLNLSEDCVHMTLKSGAVLPAFEEALKKVAAPENKRWDVQQTDKYVIVSFVLDE